MNEVVLQYVLRAIPIEECDGTETHWNWTLDGMELFPDECFLTIQSALDDGRWWVEGQLKP